MVPGSVSQPGTQREVSEGVRLSTGSQGRQPRSPGVRNARLVIEPSGSPAQSRILLVLAKLSFRVFGGPVSPQETAHPECEGGFGCLSGADVNHGRCRIGAVKCAGCPFQYLHGLHLFGLDEPQIVFLGCRGGVRYPDPVNQDEYLPTPAAAGKNSQDLPGTAPAARYFNPGLRIQDLRHSRPPVGCEFPPAQPDDGFSALFPAQRKARVRYDYFVEFFNTGGIRLAHKRDACRQISGNAQGLPWFVHVFFVLRHGKGFP